MLKRLALENFQSFGLPENIRLAPLTLIFGPNSSGKSALGRAARLAIQTIRKGEGDFFNGDLVNLLDLPTSIFNRELERKLDIAIEVPYLLLSERKRLEQSGVPDLWVPQTITVGLRFSTEGLDSVQSVTLTFAMARFGDDGNQPDFRESLDTTLSYTAATDGETTAWKFSEITGPGTNKFIDYLNASAIRLNRNEARLGESTLGVEGFGETEIRNLATLVSRQGIATSRAEMAATRWIGPVRRSLEIAIGVGGFAHIGPLRSIDDSGVHSPADPRTVASDSSNIQEFLVSMAPESQENVSDALMYLTEGRHSIHFADIAIKDNDIPLPSYKQVFVRNEFSGTATRFSDVGAGIAQALPIVAQLAAMAAPRETRHGATLWVEQPELHLHPLMQQRMADLMVMSVLDQGQKFKVGDEFPSATRWRPTQVIAETHSENIVLRLQKRIRDGWIDPKQVAVYYVDRFPGDNTSHVSELRLDTDGRFIDSWPVSFTGVRSADLFGEE